MVINKLAVVSNNEYSGVIFLEGRNKNKERELILFFFSSEDQRWLCFKVILFQNINPIPDHKYIIKCDINRSMTDLFSMIFTRFTPKMSRNKYLRFTKISASSYIFSLRNTISLRAHPFIKTCKQKPLYFDVCCLEGKDLNKR